MAVGAEYLLKQGKLHFSIDSNLAVKSSVDTNIADGVNLQLCAETSNFNNNIKLGVAIAKS
jgi:hypothetical protein